MTLLRLGSDGEALVIDAALEPELYVRLAEGRGWRVTRVLDTHVHDDHLSRSRRLAEVDGATLHMPKGLPSPTRFRSSETRTHW